MDLHLTDRQYRYLLDLVYIGNWVINSTRGNDRIKAAGGSLLKAVEFFDVYTDAPIEAGKKSVAFSLEFRSDEQNLTDKDIEPSMEKILAQLGEKLDAHLR